MSQVSLEAEIDEERGLLGLCLCRSLGAWEFEQNACRLNIRRGTNTWSTIGG